MPQQISLAHWAEHQKTLSASGATLDTWTQPCSALLIPEMPSTGYTGAIALHTVKDAMSRKLTFPPWSRAGGLESVSRCSGSALSVGR